MNQLRLFFFFFFTSTIRSNIKKKNLHLHTHMYICTHKTLGTQEHTAKNRDYGIVLRMTLLKTQFTKSLRKTKPKQAKLKHEKAAR